MNPAAAPLPLDWWALGPVLALSAGLLVLLLFELLPERPGSARAPILTLLIFGAAAALAWNVRDLARAPFGGMFVHDGFTLFFTLLFCGVGVLSTLISWDYARRTGIGRAEYYALLVSSALGMILMAASNDLIVIFLGLELMSLALYVLVGFRRSRLDSNEAAVKYFLLGAFASGFLLYGIALCYGATGTTNLARMSEFLAASPIQNNTLLVAGGLLILTGFAFKISAVPFHMWTPDAYEGAPTAVTGYMSAGAKAAGFAALLRVALHPLAALHASWGPLIAVVAVLTMTVGNVTALLQLNLKRMLAYSSIAHAGYLLLAVVAGGPDGASAALLYLAIYSVMNLGAFGVLTLLGREHEERVLLGDVAGLGFRRPWLGLAMAIFMLSLAGIPPTAGFMAKVYLFGVVVRSGHVPLVIVAVLNSVVSVFYYLRVTVAMYMEEPQGEPAAISASAPAVIALVVCVGLTLWWGVQAHSLLELAQRSVLGLM
ncbi:MAG: NADH-quinone oxidoreductase subunit N [Candidatus Eiseniibacteriota bacterium]